MKKVKHTMKKVKHTMKKVKHTMKKVTFIPAMEISHVEKKSHTH